LSHTTLTTTASPQLGEPYTLRLRVSPVAEDDASLWAGLLQRQPAVAWASPSSFEDGVARYTLGVTSLSRLHVQLNQVAIRMDARFTPTDEGELSITLRPPLAPLPFLQRATA
jgi:hypothetical protein